MTMKENNTSVLIDDKMRVQLKEKQLELLNAFICVCEKNNLKYFVVGGTALGTIRHGGFIPWDDDIDVALPRPDYQRFIEVAQKQLPEHFFLQTHRTDLDYRRDFAKIRNSKTTFVENCATKLNINHGIYIDVFPIDGYPDNKLAGYLMELRKTVSKIYVGKDYIYPDSPAKRVLRTLIQTFVKCLMGKKPTSEIISKLEQMYMQYPYETSNMVVCHGGAWKELERCEKSQYGEGVFGKFENIQVRLPEKTHAYLTHKYGNYMQLPPLEKQVGHHYCAKIDFEHSYLES